MVEGSFLHTLRYLDVCSDCSSGTNSCPSQMVHLEDVGCLQCEG